LHGVGFYTIDPGLGGRKLGGKEKGKKEKGAVQQVF
jgi:hypothetical protein